MFMLKDESSDKQMTVTEMMVARIAVELHDGCHSDQATWNAMRWQDKVRKSTEPVLFELNGKSLSIQPMESVQ